MKSTRTGDFDVATVSASFHGFDHTKLTAGHSSGAAAECAVGFDLPGTRSWGVKSGSFLAEQGGHVERTPDIYAARSA